MRVRMGKVPIRHQLIQTRRTCQFICTRAVNASSVPLDTGHWLVTLHTSVRHLPSTCNNCKAKYVGPHEIRTRQRIRAAGRRTVRQTGGRASHCSSLLLPPCSSLRPYARARSQQERSKGAATARSFCLSTFTLQTVARTYSNPLIKLIHQEEPPD